MKTSLAVQLFASAALAQSQIDFANAPDKDLLAHQALVQRLSQCSSVKIQNVATGTFLTQLEAEELPACVRVTIKKEGQGMMDLGEDDVGVAYAGQTFNFIPQAERTVRIEATGSALGLHANRRDTNVGCSWVSEDPYTTQPLHTSSNWALYRTSEIKEDSLSPDDLLQSEWYLTAQFVKDPKARLTKYDENLPETASRMLTARSVTSDAVDALLVLEDIKSLETLREQAGKFAAWANDEPIQQFNTWKFVCDEASAFVE